jgi:acetyl-CoA carboxylase biotin carboxylase subunit
VGDDAMSTPRILIANRGEIAKRLTKTIQQMGFEAITVYTSFEENPFHTQGADRGYRLTGNTLSETYLNTEAILEAACATKATMIHPGYGFLSENAEFASACQKAGLIFIGPSPEVITRMGNKITARSLMQQAGVPVVPGWEGNSDDTVALVAAAETIGYPVLIKAASGGGGKGMRVVNEPSELLTAVGQAQREAEKAFADSTVFLEKYVSPARHIEFQILGDHHGHVVHLFERECSIQRRHQKIIEESPSPSITEALRSKMGAVAIEAAKAIGYTNAGTLEFIVGPSDDFYFLEVNTRLQVEHPVTEMVLGLDLVQLQIEIALGKSLPFEQSDLKQRGHSIECRVYAENPEQGFLPCTGEVTHYQEPSGPGIRIDSGVREGSTISVFFDPMIAKVITWGYNRKAALSKMLWVLQRYPIAGLETNLAFLLSIVKHPQFITGLYHTQFLLETPVKVLPCMDDGPLLALIASQASTEAKAFTDKVKAPSVWQSIGEWGRR